MKVSREQKKTTQSINQSNFQSSILDVDCTLQSAAMIGSEIPRMVDSIWFCDVYIFQECFNRKCLWKLILVHMTMKHIWNEA